MRPPWARRVGDQPSARLRLRADVLDLDALVVARAASRVRSCCVVTVAGPLLLNPLTFAPVPAIMMPVASGFGAQTYVAAIELLPAKRLGVAAWSAIILVSVFSSKPKPLKSYTTAHL